MKEILIDNHTVHGNRGKVFGQLLLEHVFTFCNRLQKVTKNLGFHITSKTNDLQDIVYTTLPQAKVINVTFDNLHLFLPKIIRNPDTQVMFKESIKNSFTLLFDSWTTGRRVISTGSEYQLDIGSPVKVSSPKFLIAAHQTAASSGFPYIAINVSVFDHVDVKKYFVEIDGIRYPKNSVNIIYNFATNDYLDQYGDLKLFL